MSPGLPLPERIRAIPLAEVTAALEAVEWHVLTKTC
jgi:hypothetical protein